MASNVPVARTTSLPSFKTKLSPNVFLSRPDTSVSASAPSSSAKHPPPKVILFCSWMDARDAHIAKYILPYQAMYPSAAIVLVKCEMRHFVRPSVAYAEVKAAVPAIRASLDATDPAPQLLVHALSNGGSTMLRHLYRAWGEAAGATDGPGATLPLHTTFFDSAPGQWDYSGSLTAMTIGLSPLLRWVLGPFIRALIIWDWLIHFPLGRPDSFALVAEAHNDRSLVREVRRSYAYSEVDKLVGWKAVEGHAQQAKEKGFVVRVEKFEGSPHVSHMRLYQERYWKIVSETWEGVD